MHFGELVVANDSVTVHCVVIELVGSTTKWLSGRLGYGKESSSTRPFSDLGGISAQVVRRWRADLLAAGRSPVVTAKAYRLLRAIMNTAVDDELIKRNPCRIKGELTPNSPPNGRSPLSHRVFALADLLPPRFRALILAAAFTGLRWVS